MDERKEKIHRLIGIGATLVCLIVFGPDSFMIPAMLAILTLLTLFRKPIEQSYQGETTEK